MPAEHPIMRSTELLSAIPHKRDFLARLSRQLGVLGAVERTVATRRAGLIVLTYHRIAEPHADPFYDRVISATPESFQRQVEWLHTHVHLLSLNELIQRLESRSPWRELAVMLTFDDGYRDNFDVAVPILRKWHVPATFFIPTAFLEWPRLPWWDHIAYVLKKTEMRQLVLARTPNSSTPPLVIDLTTTSRSKATMTVIRAVLDETIADASWFVNQLGARAEVNVHSEESASALFMSWDHVRQLADADPDLAIGSHAHSHSKLAALDGVSQHEELAGSKHMLETRLGREITALAYPYGWPGTYTPHTKSLAAEAGYRLAFASREAANRLGTLDPYDIGRLSVGSADSLALLRARIALCNTFGRSFL